MDRLFSEKLQLELKRTDSVYITDDLIRSGRLLIVDEIREGTFQEFGQNLIWCALSGLKEIEVQICSEGGSVFHGLAIYDLIRRTTKEHGIQINTIGMGYIASIAGVIFQAGCKRFITSNASYMIHEIRTLKFGAEETSKVEDEVKLLKKLQSMIAGIYCERSILSREEVERMWERRDCWLHAEEMIGLGLADEIIQTTAIKENGCVSDPGRVVTRPTLINRIE